MDKKLKNTAGSKKKAKPRKKSNTKQIKKQNPKTAVPAKKQWQRTKLTIFSLLLAALVLGGILAVMRYRIIEITDSAMEPTLYKSQRVILDKRENLERYDLVAASINTQEQYIQRVIGLPGDSIWVEGNTVFINNNLKQDVALEPQVYANQLPTGTYSFVVDNQDVLSELSGVNNIPANRYLLLNDDFENVSDSRKFGFVNQKRIAGVLVYRIWPFSQLRSL